MRISVQGLGYAGLVSAVCLAKEGHTVIGVDIDPETAASVATGSSPLGEPRITELLAEEIASGRLQVADSCSEAVRASELTMVCVGTPSGRDGTADLSQVERVCREIGAALSGAGPRHLVVIRSTVPPGTTSRMARQIALRSGRKLGEELLTAFHPEFLREGSSVADFYDPPYTIVGTSYPEAAERLRAAYAFLDAPFVVLEEGEAELLKYASNTFHAAKVAFSNEIGRIAAAAGMNGRRIMEAFQRDHSLNLSGAYLRPGMPYGGSCLTKDLEALVQEARERSVAVPLLESIARSNDVQLEQALQLVETAAAGRAEPIGFLGLAFKQETDDLRNSPALLLAERLIERGHRVVVFDDAVTLDRIHGSNRTFLLDHAPRVAQCFASSLDRVLDRCGLLVVTNQYVERASTLDLDPSRVLSLGRLLSGCKSSRVERETETAAGSRRA